MKKFKEVKTSNNLVGAFTETVEFKVLACGNIEGNNNKFYCLELQKDPKTGAYRLFSNYGRINKTNTFGIRDGSAEKLFPITDYQTMKKQFDFVINSKLKGKKKKADDGSDRTEKYEIVETVRPTVGSENILNKALTKVQTSTTTKIDTKSFDKAIAKIIDQIIEENIHSIKNLTSLKLTSNGFETPLGPVTKAHIEKAKKPLYELKGILKNGNLSPSSRIVRDNNNLYFSLIPHDFGHKIIESDWILNEKKLVEEFELLDNLESAVQMGQALQQNSSQRMNALGTEIEMVRDTKEFEKIKNYVENSKASNHRHSSVWNYKVRNIFKLKIPDERKRFELTKNKFGNLKELFHGSKNCNILSIVKNGLIIPPCNAPGVTGRMFGNGLYFADRSSKSLNYSIGFWGGRNRNKYSNAFLFLADVAMGKSYSATRSLYSGIPKGYDSIFAKQGADLYNNEYIVKQLCQVSLTYLVEMQ